MRLRGRWHDEVAVRRCLQLVLCDVLHLQGDEELINNSSCGILELLSLFVDSGKRTETAEGALKNGLQEIFPAVRRPRGYISGGPLGLL